MTIEEKVGSIVHKSIDNFLSGNDEASEKATQAILDLIKPMSRESLVKLIGNIVNKGLMDSKDTAQIIEDQADAILAEWGKE